MSSKVEKRLEINRFAGIDRFADGTVISPNKFYTMQNMHPIGPGELASIGGTDDVSGAVDMAGIGKIIKTQFMKDALGNSCLLAFFKPEAGLSWTPSATDANFTKTGTTYNVTSFLVTYVGPGGLVKSNAALITPSFGTATTVTFTTPLDVPDWVAQIDIYLDPHNFNSGISHGNLARMASIHRKANGLFPSTVAFSARYHGTNTTTSTAPALLVPDTIKSNVTSGNVRRLYFGIAPHFFDFFHKPRVCLVDSQAVAQALVADVDIDGTSTIKMNFSRASPGFGTGTTGEMRVGDFPVRAMLPFAGVTPEDLVLTARSSASDPGDGCSTFVDLTSFEFTITAANTTTEKLTLSAVTGLLADISDGEVVLFEENGGTSPGLTSGNRYWVKKTSATTVQLFSSFENYSLGVPVNLTGAVTGSPKLFMQQVSFLVTLSGLRNSRNGVFMCKLTPTGTAPNATFYGEKNITPPDSLTAQSGRTDGIFQNNSYVYENLVSGSSVGVDYFIAGGAVLTTTATYPAVTETNVVGCYVIRQFPFTLANSHQLLPSVNERTLSQSSLRIFNHPLARAGLGLFWNPVLNNPDENSQVISCTQFRNRVFTANGDNILWYTNGYVWKPTMRTDGKDQIPQSRYVQAFSNRLVAAGGNEAIQNSNNVYYVSEEETPFDWGVTVNAYTVFSKQPINGLGVYSQNLTDQGFAQFLIISKKDALFSWDGSSDRGPQSLYYSFGFAGPRAFGITDFGPVFVGRENIYLIQGDRIQEIGREVSPILKALTETQLHRISAIYHDRILKIGYPAGAGTDPDSDSELWLEMRAENGEMSKYISGPHALKAFYDQDAALEFGGTRAIRASCQDDNIYQRDTGNDNNGASIAMSLVINRLGLKADNLRKLLNEISLSMKIAANETVSIGIAAEDGSSAYSSSEAVLFSVAARQFVQHLLTQRVSGRVNALTIGISTQNPVSIYDIELLFKVQRRGTLRYGS